MQSHGSAVGATAPATISTPSTTAVIPCIAEFAYTSASNRRTPPRAVYELAQHGALEESGLVPLRRDRNPQREWPAVQAALYLRRIQHSALGGMDRQCAEVTAPGPNRQCTARLLSGDRRTVVEDDLVVAALWYHAHRATTVATFGGLQVGRPTGCASLRRSCARTEARRTTRNLIGHDPGVLSRRPSRRGQPPHPSWSGCA